MTRLPTNSVLETKVLLFAGIQSLLFNVNQTSVILNFFTLNGFFTFKYFTTAFYNLEDYTYFFQNINNFSKLTRLDVFYDYLQIFYGAINNYFYNLQNFKMENTIFTKNNNHYFTLEKLFDLIDIQINFSVGIKFFFKRKFFLFFILTITLVTMMSFSLLYLCRSTNLIYSLISFLIFAVIGGFLTILWGSEYIGLCIILIYGAAIPVLALYIIMLVNVDLLQRLFFIESSKFFSNLIGFKILICGLLLISILIYFNLFSYSYFANTSFNIINLLQEYYFFNKLAI